MTPEMRAFLEQPAGAHHHQGQRQVARASPRPSRLCRRQAVSAEDGRLEGELRIVGLFTSSAYTEHDRARCPICATRSRRSSPRAGFDPASYAGRALLNVLENYPRDELFQIDEDTLYRFAIDIMNLSERPRIRALARVDEFDRFVSVLVFIPKDRYDSQVRRRVGEFLARHLPGPPLGRLSGLPGRAARAHALHHRPRRRRRRRRSTRDDARERHRRDRPHLGRRPARPRSTDTIGGPRARALADALCRTPSAPPIARPSAPSRRSADIDILEQLSAERGRAPSISTAAKATRATRVNLKVFSRGAPLPLSERVPLLENLGFRVVNERTYRVAAAGAAPEAERVWLHDMALERAAGGPIDIDGDRGRDRGGAAGAVPRACRIRRLQPPRPRSRPRLARRRHGARARPLPAPGPHRPTRRIISPKRWRATAASRASSSRCSMPASTRAPKRIATRDAQAAIRAEIEDAAQGGRPASTTTASCAASSISSKPRSAPTSSRSTRTGCRAQRSPSSSNAPRSTRCRCRVRSTRSSSIRRASRACTCASARSRAAACAGPTGRRISAPRCSASSRRSRSRTRSSCRSAPRAASCRSSCRPRATGRPGSRKARRATASSCARCCELTDNIDRRRHRAAAGHRPP